MGVSFGGQVLCEKIRYLKLSRDTFDNLDRFHMHDSSSQPRTLPTDLAKNPLREKQINSLEAGCC